MIQVQAIDDQSSEQIADRFNLARSQDYQELIDELHRIQKQRTPATVQLASARRRYEEITAIDFFNSPLRKRAEDLLLNSSRLVMRKQPLAKASIKTVRTPEFQNRTWVTRPRPGIDRVSSAWLVKKFIDPAAKFVFATRATAMPDAIPFDMFEGKGFQPRG